jgi:hypothetical protein
MFVTLISICHILW